MVWNLLDISCADPDPDLMIRDDTFSQFWSNAYQSINHHFNLSTLSQAWRVRSYLNIFISCCASFYLLFSLLCGLSFNDEIEIFQKKKRSFLFSYT